MKLIIFVQLFYRDYERSRDFRGRRLELTPGSDSVGTQSLTSLLTSMHFCVRTVIAHQCLLRPLLNC